MNFKNVKINVLAIAVMILFSLLIFTDEINVMNNRFLGYDAAYNATVAANVMRYGEYRVSYPENILFFNAITTGETVILPTALLYKLFGINRTTSAIVALIYGILDVWVIWLLLRKVFKKSTESIWLDIFVAIGTMGIILTDGYFDYISSSLIGESACIFFLLISFSFLTSFLNSRKKYLILVSGAMLASAFLTKSSMIFFVVSMFGMLIVEIVITRRLLIKELLYYLCGFLLGFVFLDSYKFVQLGGFAEYVSWWRAEWDNMLNQSSGVDLTYSISDKIQYLESIFGGYNKWICLIFVLLPVCLYLFYVWNKLWKGKLCSNEHLIMLMSGVGGASLIIFFILLGGSGLVYARRHSVNALFIKIFIAYMILYIFFYVCDKWQKQNIIQSVTLIVLLIACIAIVFPVARLRSRIYHYIVKEKQPSYGLELMNEFLGEVEEIPKEATLYCVGWWQEPEVTLFLDRNMKDINDVINGNKVLDENSYLIVGTYIHDVKIEYIQNNLKVSLIRMDRSEVNYDVYSAFNREDFDNFAIYKIIKDFPA